MIKIKFLTNVTIMETEQSFAKDDVAEFSEEVAESLVERGLAEIYVEAEVEEQGEM